MENDSVEHINDDRIIVLVCVSCRKLIGTRENYYLVTMNGKKYNLCEGCHDEDNN
jgi:predicted CXXCH cytochrome family protein